MPAIEKSSDAKRSSFSVYTHGSSGVAAQSTSSVDSERRPDVIRGMATRPSTVMVNVPDEKLATMSSRLGAGSTTFVSCAAASGCNDDTNSSPRRAPLTLNPPLLLFIIAPPRVVSSTDVATVTDGGILVNHPNGVTGWVRVLR